MDERIAAARKVRDQFPSDYYAHRFYQDKFASDGVYSQSIQDEYKALREAHPGDLTYQMMYARTLPGRNTREAISLLDKIAERQPDYAPAHLKLVEIYATPAFGDNTMLRAHTEAYWKACPASLGVYARIGHVDDADFLKRAAARLRLALADRTDDEALNLYGLLWNMEFKAVPLSRQNQPREYMRHDAARLRAIGFLRHPYVLKELAQAYQTLGDQEGLAWVAENLPEGERARPDPARNAIVQWHKEHASAGAPEIETYVRAWLEQTGEWIRRWPDDPLPRYERFQAFQRMPNAPLGQAVQAAEDWLRVHQEHPGMAPPYMVVASYYAQHSVHLDQVAGLVGKALEGLVPERRPRPVSDLYPERSPVPQPDFFRLSQLEMAARIYVQVKEYEKASDVLAGLGTPLLDAVRTGAGKQGYGYLEIGYWSDMAALARARGERVLALVAERNALQIAFRANPRLPQNRIASLRESWHGLTGSDAGFDAWLADAEPNAARATPAAAITGTAWTALAKPLPDFQMFDAAGKTWRLADLKGKVTLVNLWATWCGPCRNELPYLQKVFDKVRERDDLAVLTLNADDNPGLVPPFLEENQYTFPVLPAVNYLVKLLPEFSVPRNWIVDAEGVLRQERIGFTSGGERWVDEMIAAMEKARPGKN